MSEAEFNEFMRFKQYQKTHKQNTNKHQSNRKHIQKSNSKNTNTHQKQCAISSIPRMLSSVRPLNKNTKHVRYVDHKNKQLYKELDLPYFNTLNIQKGFSMYINAPTNSGKSYIIRSVMYELRDEFDSCLIISGTESFSHDPVFKPFVSELYIHDAFDGDMINSMLDNKQKEKKKFENINIARKLAGKKPYTNNSHRVIAIDDCGDERRNVDKCKGMGTLFKNGRHFGLSLLITGQTTKDLSPQFKSQCKYVMIFGFKSQDEIKSLYKDFGSGTGDFYHWTEFEEAYNKICKNHRVMVISKGGIDGSDKSVYWYEACPESMSESFMFGSDKFIKYGKDHYNPNATIYM